MSYSNPQSRKINIAVDGPAGAGKSTLARMAAQELGFVYADTGALYRAVALFMLQRGVDLHDSAAVIRSLPMANVELRFADGEQRVYLCGENVSSAIRTPELSRGASTVSAYFAVREFLLELQKEIAERNDCIMDGRDIGTIVLPDAQLKIWLTASAEERAVRRLRELEQRNIKAELEDIIEEIRQRDYNDENRAISPMKPAPDAVVLDTTGLGLDGAVDALLEVIYRRFPRLLTGDGSDTLPEPYAPQLQPQSELSSQQFDPAQQSAQADGWDDDLGEPEAAGSGDELKFD